MATRYQTPRTTQAQRVENPLGPIDRSPRWLRKAGASPNALIAWMVLDEHSTDGAVDLTVAHLADEMGVSLATAKRALGELGDLGAVARGPGRDSGGRAVQITRLVGWYGSPVTRDQLTDEPQQGSPVSRDDGQQLTSEPRQGSPVSRPRAHVPLSRDIPTREVKPPLTPPASPDGDGAPTATQVAKRLIDAAYAQLDPKPHVHGGTCKQIAALLANGWSEDAVAAALLDAATWTPNALEVSLRRRRPSRAQRRDLPPRERYDEMSAAEMFGAGRG